MKTQKKPGSELLKKNRILKNKVTTMQNAFVQLDDYFNLGEVCFHTSKRFPFAHKLIKKHLPK